MPRLPAWAEPAFPAIKSTHLAATRTMGAAARTVPLGRARAVPTRATARSTETAALEPDTTRLLPTPARPQARWLHSENDGGAEWFWDDVRQLGFGDSFVLELDHGIAVGTAGAHLTAANTLDFQTSPYFGARTWKEHPLFLRGSLPPIEKIDGTVASLATRGTTGNYFHFLFDSLPRWKTLLDSEAPAPDALLISSQSAWERRLMELVGLPDLPLIQPQKQRAIRADRLLVPSMVTYEDLVPTWAIQWLREQLPARDTAGLAKRIYVSRGDRVNSRRVVQERALIAALRPLGFEVIEPGGLDIQGQVDQFAAAEIVVAGHGAALSNLVFCSPGVKVLELFAPRYVNACYWSILASIPDARYRYLVGRGRPPVHNRKKLRGVYADIDIDVTDVVEQVQEFFA